MIEELFVTYGIWAWLSVGAVLICIEVAAPGAFFLWIAVAAIVTGLVTAVAPEFAWKGQLALFAVLSVVVSILGRRFFRWRPISSEQPNLNQRGAKFVGREYTLSEAIVNGSARLKMGETGWRIEGPDLPEGTRVRVVGIEGATLKVEAL